MDGPQPAPSRREDNTAVAGGRPRRIKDTGEWPDGSRAEVVTAAATTTGGGST